MFSFIFAIGLFSLGNKLKKIANGKVLDDCAASVVPLWIDIANICN